MSVNKSVDPNGIGYVDWEEKNLFDPKSWVKTYGQWAGPGWSGGERTDNAHAVANVLPCDNNLVDENTGKHLQSKLDAAAREHDLDYENGMGILNADIKLLNAVRLISSGEMDTIEAAYAESLKYWFDVKISHFDEWEPTQKSIRDAIKIYAAETLAFNGWNGGVYTMSIGDGSLMIEAQKEPDNIVLDELTLNLNGQTAATQDNSLIADFINEYGRGKDNFTELIIDFGEGNGIADNLNGSSGDDLIFAENGNDDIIAGGGNDVIYGGIGADTIDGGTGVDIMVGGDGDDVYRVDNVDDVIIENEDEGTDTVISTSNYVMGNNIEYLALDGVDSINGTGNDLNNAIQGNNAVNILAGGVGDDSIWGGAGNDMIYGGVGLFKKNKLRKDKMLFDNRLAA